MDDYRKIQEMQRINRIKENNNCLTCEVVITKELLKREFPEINEIIPMLNRNGGMRTAYKQVESWGRF